MLYTGMLLLHALCFDAESNKMKATSEAIIKIKALKMWVPDNIGCRCSVVKKEGICCAAVKDRKCRLCSANLKMKGNLNFKLHGSGLWLPGTANTEA